MLNRIVYIARVTPTYKSNNKSNPKTNIHTLENFWIFYNFLNNQTANKADNNHKFHDHENNEDYVLSRQC